MNNPFELIINAEAQIAEINTTIEEIKGLGLDGESAQKLIDLTKAHELAKTELMERKLELFRLLIKVISILPASERVYHPHAGVCDYHIIDENTIRAVSRDGVGKKPAGTYNPKSFILTRDLFHDDLIKQIMLHLSHHLTHASKVRDEIKTKLLAQIGELGTLIDLCNKPV